jgi:hypothetical protein
MAEGKIVPVKITCGLLKKKMDSCGTVNYYFNNHFRQIYF